MIVTKPYTDEQYADLAVYCNENDCYIEDKGDYLESVKKPEPTIDERNEMIRVERQNRYGVESDPLRLDYDEALARGEETAEQLKQDWLASKDKIREELPYIVGEQDAVEEG